MKRKLTLLSLTALLATACNQSIPFGVGFEQIEPAFVCSDYNKAYAPAQGDVKLLVIPVAFTSGSKLRDWTESKLNTIDDSYFGSSPYSLMNYYNTASFGQMNFNGMVSKIYYESTYSSTYVNATDDYERVFDVIERAAAWVQQEYPNVDWSEYDLNNDGNFDNIHLITNYVSEVWAEPLWPHMFRTNRESPKDKLGVDVYSVSAINHMTNSITAIHEQGHIFGLQDYYDYGYTGVDYIGGLDMQDHNCFDWNSFSKFSVGWVNPYVYTGEKKSSKFTLKAASINGDCLVIPANIDTYNGSAFDEYFILELFSPFGNNELWWDYYPELGDYGVRMYHVDARLWGGDTLNGDKLVVEDLEGQQVNSIEDVAKYKYVQMGANNCYDFNDYEEGVEQQKNHQLLQLVQAGGTNSFGSTRNNSRHNLEENDLFHQGDVFTFNDYSTFLTKDLKKVDTTNKGEVFPYKITFERMNEEEVTIRIETIVK